MAGSLFTFVQAEYPWALGPADGRYLLRGDDGRPSHIVVLATLGAPRRRRLSRRRRRRPATSAPAPVSTTRATIIDADSHPEQADAQRWLAAFGAADAHEALEVLNRVLFAHRIASADAGVHEVSASRALVVRAGWGEGEQVADGQWREAAELAVPERRRRRTAVLRPQERLAVLLGGRGQALVAEELALRARLDLDHGREHHAALELRGAYALAILELGEESGVQLAERVAELQQLRPGVEAVARAVLEGADPDATIGHALERLEAALRARTAAGFHRLPEPSEAEPGGARPAATPPPPAGGRRPTVGE